MRAVFFHRQQMPNVPVEIRIEILDQRRRWVLSYLSLFTPDQTLDPGKIRRGTGVESLQELMDRNRAFTIAAEVHGFFLHRSFRKSGDMTSSDDDQLLRNGFLNCQGKRTCSGHLLSGS